MNDHPLINDLRAIVGRRHVLTLAGRVRPFATGYRFGGGPVLAVIRPANLREMWRSLHACVAANVIVIMQAANTGLTGGSTPDGNDYDRPVVIFNTLRINTIHTIESGRQVICLPGATLDRLETLLKPLGREPHSVIGSSCIGASVMGGVCNNSGGALVRRGPAYTELSLFARIRHDGTLELVNHLDIDLGDMNDPESALARLESGHFTQNPDSVMKNAASDPDYAAHVRAIDAATPARFNADPRRLYESSGCAGKLAVFAVRLDSFESEPDRTLFYIGTRDPAILTGLRRAILRDLTRLPVAAEYIHATAYDIAERYGKDVFLAIRHLGTGFMPTLFRWKSRVDSACDRVPFLPRHMSDRILQSLSRLFPSHLPPRMRDMRARYDHHLLLQVTADQIGEARAILNDALRDVDAGYFECTGNESKSALLHRFAVAGAAVRYRAVHSRRVSDIVALDIALRRNDSEWFETLPPDIETHIVHKLYYGHFLCHVFHQDYIIRAGSDPHIIETAMLKNLDARGAEYPAEHNVGHLYAAKPELAGFYRALDPTNGLNPGVGKTSKRKNWA